MAENKHCGLRVRARIELFDESKANFGPTTHPVSSQSLHDARDHDARVVALSLPAHVVLSMRLASLLDDSQQLHHQVRDRHKAMTIELQSRGGS